jgi:prepilin-type N-terminal cleavage/methylation domain-containing protein
MTRTRGTMTRTARALRTARLSGRAGFTMVEVLIASALLGFSLIVMFGFHSQALRANMNARRLTDCTYLAQTQMERLLAMDWASTSRPTELTNGGSVDADAVGVNDELEWPTGPVEVNAVNSTSGSPTLPSLYTVTWDVEDMDANATWVRLRVRCTYEDSAFNTRHGTTISSFRYRDS